MKEFTIWSVMMLFLAGVVSAATGVGEYVPVLTPLDEGGPDDYGYTWVDNDGGGGPDYNWIDISGIGEEVLGLQDDNNIGPFPLGFDFAYYWYMVDHCWIGSNGYLSFSSNANHAHPFQDIPDSRQPNDLVAVLTGDLDFRFGEPSCYYYTNNADTFIVSWINVREYDLPQTHHTFQVIFSAADSSILFQYGETEGSFSGTDVIGIEDVVGRVGLQYLRNNYPPDQMWHEGLAIRFHPEPLPDFVFHDFGAADGFQEGSGANFIPNGEPYTIRALGKNFGTEAEDNLRLRCQIRRGTSPVYDDTVYVDHLEPGEEVWVEYADQFTPSQVSTYRVTFTAIMSGDENPSNNTKICELDSYELPQELQYCNDTAEEGRAWNGDFSGFGVEYEMPEAIEVTSASFNVNSVSTAGPAYVWILPDDGTGQPDEANPLAADTVTVYNTGWIDIDFSWAGLTFEPNEKFFVVAIHANQSTFWFGMDNDPPLSYRGWEYTGGLAPDRNREVSDIMIKVMANAATGIDDYEISPKSFSISQNYPNPFNARTNISFSIDRESDVSIGIYNVAGQRVADLSDHFKAGENLVTWDAFDIATGIYFYRIEYNNAVETRKMVLLK